LERNNLPLLGPFQTNFKNVFCSLSIVNYFVGWLVHAVYAFLQINWAAKDECKGLVDVMKSHPDIAIDLCTFFQKNSFPGFVAGIGKK